MCSTQQRAMFRVWFNKNDEATTTLLLRRRNTVRFKKHGICLSDGNKPRRYVLRFISGIYNGAEARIVIQKIDKNCVK